MAEIHQLVQQQQGPHYHTATRPQTRRSFTAKTTKARVLSGHSPRAQTTAAATTAAATTASGKRIELLCGGGGKQQPQQGLHSRTWLKCVARPSALKVSTGRRLRHSRPHNTASATHGAAAATTTTAAASQSPWLSSPPSLVASNHKAPTLSPPTSPASLSSASAASTWSWLSFGRLGVNYNLRKDSAFMLATMFAVVMAIVIAENTVCAAQRDSFKQKNPNNLSNNANAIPIGTNGNVNGNGSGAGNAAIAPDANTTIHGSNGNSNNSNRHGNDNISNGNPHGNANAADNINSGNDENDILATTTTVASASIVTTATVAAPVTTSSSGGSSRSGGTSVAAASNRNTIDISDDLRNGPYFDKPASKNVTALLGKTAYLNCRVKNLGNKTMLLQVSWVRHRDIHLLTVGRYTYTSDQRFRAIHQPQTEDWILQIKYPQHRDSGIYECQVSTTPHMSHYIHLTVVEPSTEIIGAPDLYIESGSTINLTCVILNSPEPPAYIFWNHNNAIINYDSPRGGVSVVTNKGETTTSFLLIKSARPSDSGHYQCNPSNAKPKSVTVHVLNGEFPAAMQRAGQAHHRMSQSHYLLVYLSMYLCSLAYVTLYLRPSLAEVAGPEAAITTSAGKRSQRAYTLRCTAARVGC